MGQVLPSTMHFVGRVMAAGIPVAIVALLIRGLGEITAKSVLKTMKISDTAWGIVNMRQRWVWGQQFDVPSQAINRFLRQYFLPSPEETPAETWERIQGQGYRCVRVTLTAEVEG